jgi:glycerol-3-phosphate dehydrogenase (NAD(P)+)
MADIRNVAVLGGGAWGTALAVHLAARSHTRPRVTLYVRSAAQARDALAARENRRYLPRVPLPLELAITSQIADAAAADLLIAATPVAELPSLVDTLRDAGVGAPLVSLSKGFVATAGPPSPSGSTDLVAAVGATPAWSLPHEALRARWPHPVGTVTGPTFAVEVAQGLPTALVVATTDRAFTADVAGVLRGDALRAYASDDLAGVEIGGAVKNVYAIAAGASDGLGFGDNARAALITRGLAESGRLSTALGGRRETLMGLAGLGDLVLTCTGNLSRNRRVGLALSRGQPLAAILAEIGHVAEGVAATRAAHDLARQHALDMPLVAAVYKVLYENVPPREAVLALLAREPRADEFGN